MIMVLHVRRTAAATLILVLATVAPRQHVTAFVFPISSTAPTNRRRETPRTQFRNSNINSARNSKSSRRIGRRRSANNRVRPALWSPSSALRTCTDTRRNTRLNMVLSNPIDVDSVAESAVSTSSPVASSGAASSSPSSSSSSSRARLPAERGVNEVMNGFNAGVVDFLKSLMVRYYGERTYARFYALETIARVPYFGYLCVLHLYETLGQWRQAEYLKVHFAESYNELHHLLIMEELGGNLLFKDRWFAQHAAFFYFFVVVGLYLSNPRNAYNLNQHVEEHAFSTYDTFLSENAEELKEKPAPVIAQKYYGTDKLYVFNGLHNDPHGSTFEERDLDRPVISNLFDTFVAVRNDEWEHVKTMKALQEDVTEQQQELDA